MDAHIAAGLLLGAFLAIVFLQLPIPTWLGILLVGKPLFKKGDLVYCSSIQGGAYLLVRERFLARVRQKEGAWVYSGTFFKVNEEGRLVYSTTGSDTQETLAAIPLPA